MYSSQDKVPEYIIHSCNYCGRKFKVASAEFMKTGAVCPGCGNHCRQVKKLDINLAEEPPFPPPVDNAETTITAPSKRQRRQDCPGCGQLIDIVHPLKLLERCPSCGVLFVQDKSEEARYRQYAEQKSTESEADKQSQNEQDVSTPPTKDDSKEKHEQDSKHDKKSRKNAKAPTETASFSQPVLMPSEKQIETLRQFGILGELASGIAASEIISSVTEIITDVYAHFYVSFDLLPYETKFKVFCRTIVSPAFDELYFNNSAKLNPDDLDAIILDCVKDREIRAAIKIYIKDIIFREAIKYIYGFTSNCFNLTIEESVAREIALKAFHRGFGNRLRTFGNIVYGAHGQQTTKAANASESELVRYYSRKTKANSALTKLLYDMHLINDEWQPEAEQGCLSAAIILASLGILIFL